MDEPPRSDAGQDVVIQLPTDWAVLDGRDSVDDHGISRYEWTLVRGDTAINMKVGVNITLSVLLVLSESSLQPNDSVQLHVCAAGAAWEQTLEVTRNKIHNPSLYQQR